MACRAAVLLWLLLGARHAADAALLQANSNLSCRCAKTTATFIPPRTYSSVEVRPAGSSCRRQELIITLKNRKRVCVDPDSSWVKKLLQDLPSLRKKEAPR
ncbi:C-X-C motif chemokine 13 [Rhea pennata]|uniref:C-X-C motif chemokine 13 n=1 Tax=Rhea pennata TaxID=8795 RepID=UPI002E259B20